MSPGKFSLSFKLTACLMGGMVLIFSILGYQNVVFYKAHLEHRTFVEADSTSGLIKASMRYSMLKNHREEVYQIIKTIGRERAFNKIRIFNKEGRISFSTDEAEVGAFVDKNAEACYKCHAQAQPLTKLHRPDRVRTYSSPGGERILGLINPIENEESCYNASCHAHGPDQTVLGVLDVTLSLAEADQAIAQGRSTLLLNVVLAGVLISVLVALLVWALVNRPMKKLQLGMQRVGGGDLDSKIEVSSRDEVGQLAAAFNQMTEEIKRADDQLKEAARTLEARVDEKTAALKQAHEQMIQVERLASMGKLAAIVAHEVNNPLAGILMSARFLIKKLEQGGLGPDVAREHLDLMAQEAGRCGEIVKNLLEFTRQAKGKYQPCEVKGLIEDSLRLVQHKLDLMTVEVRRDIEEGVPPVLGDPQEIKQALVAVLINACEAMVQGERALEVGARHRSGEGKIEIWIKDNGVGMDEETKKHIFEPFFTTKAGARSVGLGLSVVSGILSRHAGKIEVESTVGAGTRVTITLPVCMQDGAPAGNRTAG
jgi:two-component system NtrC family sensor kinase